MRESGTAICTVHSRDGRTGIAVCGDILSGQVYRYLAKMSLERPAGVMVANRIGLEIQGPSNAWFRISDFLGRGAFGEVYRAIDVRTGAPVAVKLLPLADLDDEGSRVALINEIQTAKEVRHPNVIRVLHVDTGTQDDLGPYVVMEYVSGGNLAKLFRGQARTSTLIPLEHATEIAIGIAQGTRAINERLIHRDIKPDNILLDEGKPKIGDFGISKFIDQTTRSRTFKGRQHVAYMAPEAWLSQKNTEKIDTYAVGIVFFEILTLQHPFLKALKDPDDWRQWERAHLFENPPDPRSLRAEVPASLSQLIVRMLNKRPEDRPGWDEVVGILDNSRMPAPRRVLVAEAVEAALKRKDELEKVNLQHAEIAQREQRRRELYAHSCRQLLGTFSSVVDDFNSEFQHGRIQISERKGEWDIPGNVTYKLPTGGFIECVFFSICNSSPRIRGGAVAGGGHVSVFDVLPKN